jgi:hypothetical protein
MKRLWLGSLRTGYVYLVFTQIAMFELHPPDHPLGGSL